MVTGRPLSQRSTVDRSQADLQLVAAQPHLRSATVEEQLHDRGTKEVLEAPAIPARDLGAKHRLKPSRGCILPLQAPAQLQDCVSSRRQVVGRGKQERRA